MTSEFINFWRHRSLNTLVKILYTLLAHLTIDLWKLVSTKSFFYNVSIFFFIHFFFIFELEPFRLYSISHDDNNILVIIKNKKAQNWGKRFFFRLIDGFYEDN